MIHNNVTTNCEWIYKSLLKIFAHIHEPTVQRKDISRWKILKNKNKKNSLANNVEPQNNDQHILKDDLRLV